MARVMIVENIEKPLWMAKKLLSAINYEIIFETGNGYEAIEKYDLIKPDLILLDLDPSKNTGLNIIQEIKKKNSESRIIALTRNSNPEVIQSCIDYGALQCITIPINMKDFVSILSGIENFSETKSEVSPLIIEES